MLNTVGFVVTLLISSLVSVHTLRSSGIDKFVRTEEQKIRRQTCFLALDECQKSALPHTVSLGFCSLRIQQTLFVEKSLSERGDPWVYASDSLLELILAEVSSAFRTFES